MPIFNYKAREMILKIVYYGPGLCGKTTSLQYLHQQTIPERKGELYFLATETDETIYFELLPLHVGEINNFKLRLQVYTVPGQVKYNNTRKAVLQGVDAIVFIADSQKTRQKANIISFKNLQYNLKGGYNILLQNLPLIYEYNKRDMENILSVEELNHDLNPWQLPYFETVAIEGKGVLDAFETISSLTIMNLEKRFLKSSSAGWEEGIDQSSKSLAFFQQQTERDDLEEKLLLGDKDVSFLEDEEAIMEDGSLFADDQIFPAGEGQDTILPTEMISEDSHFPDRSHKELSYIEIVSTTYHDADIIFEEGESGDSMYFIEEGQVNIIGSYKDTRKVVVTYSKGDFFGEMALFGGKPRSARAVAVGKTRLLPVTKATLSAQIFEKPEIALALLEALSGRIRHNTKTISKLANQKKELMEHLRKARNVILQMRGQNDALRQKLEDARQNNPPDAS